MLGGDHLLGGGGVFAAAEAFSATLRGVMTTPRQARVVSSSTAQIRLRALVSPGTRPITLVRRRTSTKGAFEQVRAADSFAVLGRPAQVRDQGVEVVGDDGHRRGVGGLVVGDDRLKAAA